MSDYGDVNDFQYAKNQIHFKVDNQTSFDLEPQEYYAYFGDFDEEPSEIQSNSSGSGGHIMSSRMASSAGMVGYKITGGSETLYLQFLALNLSIGIQDNSSNSAILDYDDGINQSSYKSLEEREEKDDTRHFNGGTLIIESQIGQSDDATAHFIITFEE